MRGEVKRADIASFKDLPLYAELPFAIPGRWQGALPLPALPGPAQIFLEEGETLPVEATFAGMAPDLSEGHGEQQEGAPSQQQPAGNFVQWWHLDESLKRIATNFQLFIP